MKRILLATAVITIVLCTLYFVWNKRVKPYGLSFDPQSRFAKSSAQVQRMRAHIAVLMSEGEQAIRDGDLESAEAKFESVLNDKSSFFGKADYDRKAYAELTKVREQKNRVLKSETS